MDLPRCLSALGCALLLTPATADAHSRLDTFAAPAVAPIMCVIDTGFAPDATDVTLRSTGPQPATAEQRVHGTGMSATIRDWNRHVRIIGVEVSASTRGVLDGLTACLTVADVSVIVGALVSADPASIPAEQTDEARALVRTAAAQNINVVWAAGNHGPGPAGWPASALPGIVTVGAVSALTGQPCAFSATDQVTVAAVGCDTPGMTGTSGATARAAATVAALRALTGQDAMQAAKTLRVSADTFAHGAVLNAERALRSSGARITRLFGRPIVTITRRAGRYALRPINAPVASSLRVSTGRWQVVTAAGVLTVPAAAKTVTVTYERDGKRLASGVVRLRPGAQTAHAPAKRPARARTPRSRLP